MRPGPSPLGWWRPRRSRPGRPKRWRSVRSTWRRVDAIRFGETMRKVAAATEDAAEGFTSRLRGPLAAVATAVEEVVRYDSQYGAWSGRRGGRR